MSRFTFNATQRYAVWVVHGEKCYLCTRPVDLKSMEVDHIIPEHLLDDSLHLAEVLSILGRPTGFSLNSFANWMPSCQSCNAKKLGELFEPTPLVQLILQRAAEKSTKAEALAEQAIGNRKIAKALNVLQRADERGELDDAIRLALQPLVSFLQPQRTPEMATEPIRLTATYSVHVSDYPRTSDEATRTIIANRDCADHPTTSDNVSVHVLRGRPDEDDSAASPPDR
jgi:hypothetical protein